jgi:AraC-like DNA-binding protein
MITRVNIQQKEELLHWKTRVEKVKQYIETHLSEDLHLTTVSKKLEYNKFTLRNIFKEQQHESYHGYVERKRMEKALNLLLGGKWIKEVMSETGYRHSSTFNKAFKKRYNNPPGHFRK